MDKKEHYRRAWSLIRYEQLDSDYYPTKGEIRYEEEEVKGLDLEMLGAAYRDWIIDWYGPIETYVKGRYLKKYEEKQMKDRYNLICIRPEEYEQFKRFKEMLAAKGD